MTRCVTVTVAERCCAGSVRGGVGVLRVGALRREQGEEPGARLLDRRVRDDDAQIGDARARCGSARGGPRLPDAGRRPGRATARPLPGAGAATSAATTAAPIDAVRRNMD